MADNPTPDPIRKGLLPCTPPAEWEFHTVLGARSDTEGVALFPGDAGPVVIRRLVTYGDWEPVRPELWAAEPKGDAAAAPAAVPSVSVVDQTTRDRIADRGTKAEALLLHFTAEAHRRKWNYDRGLDDDGQPIKSEAFGALHRLGDEMNAALHKLRATPAAVLPPPADRAAVDRQQVIEALYEARRPGLGSMTEADAVAHMADAVLRRLADEAQQPAVGARQPDTETRQQPETEAAHSCGNCEGIDPDSCLTNLDRPAVKAQQAATKTPDEAPDQWCKCRSCWGWFVEEHPGEDLDELGKDLGWWSGLPVHRDAPAAVSAVPGRSAATSTDEETRS